MSVGKPLPEAVVRAAILIRVNSLLVGHSGIRPEVIDLLVSFLNEGIYPFVPAKGSLGASGDLSPLAHLALVLIGEGECFQNGEKIVLSSHGQFCNLFSTQLNTIHSGRCAWFAFFV